MLFLQSLNYAQIFFKKTQVSATNQPIKPVKYFLGPDHKTFPDCPTKKAILSYYSSNFNLFYEIILCICSANKHSQTYSIIRLKHSQIYNTICSCSFTCSLLILQATG